MVSASVSATVFNVSVEEKSGLFFGTSTEIKGLFIAKRSADDVLAAVPDAVSDLFAAFGVNVVVSPVGQVPGSEPLWVAVPAEIAERGLARFIGRASN